MAIFQPTETSRCLIKAVKPYIKKGRLLELGCGSGIIGRSLISEDNDVMWFASDVDPVAVDNLYDKHGLISDGRVGSLFEPWKFLLSKSFNLESNKFTYIVDDVSGVHPEVAIFSPWFEGISNESVDGSELLIKVLEQAPDYLTKNGLLFFPIVSLSNIDRALETANKIYNLELLSHNEFPIPQTMLNTYEYYEIMYNLKERKQINYKTKYGIEMFWTDIYKAKVK